MQSVSLKAEASPLGLRRRCGVHSDLIWVSTSSVWSPREDLTSEENKGSRRLVRERVHVGGDHGVEAVPTPGSRLGGSDDALDCQGGRGVSAPDADPHTGPRSPTSEPRSLRTDRPHAVQPPPFPCAHIHCAALTPFVIRLRGLGTVSSLYEQRTEK